MKKIEKETTIPPIAQLNLFGYDKHFELFSRLFNINKLPNTILLTGEKGIGKATFAYHFINYLFSLNDKKKYSTNEFFIDPENTNYKLINNFIHPNFFLIENSDSDQSIKIEQVKHLKIFLNKTTYSRNLKVVLIDNAEDLNLSSSNSLLKSIEEPDQNTFFFIIHDSSRKLLNTIISRCIEFKIHFSKDVKKDIFNKIIKQYENNFYQNLSDKMIQFSTPGNLLKYFIIFKNEKIDPKLTTLESISFLMDSYKNSKSKDTLLFLTTLIQLYYNNLSTSNNKDYIGNFFNYDNILNQIFNMRKFNLDDKNTFISIKNTLFNEAK